MNVAIEQDIRDVARRVDEIITSTLKGEPYILYDAALHYITSGGKRLRPYMLVKCSELCNGSADKALYIASAMEMVHNFTLVHDDIMDGDEVRHGVPTVHRAYGLPYGILAGDLLLIYAFKTVAYYGRMAGLDDSTIVRLVDVLAKYCIVLSEGQAMDMEIASSTTIPDEEQYIAMVTKKTASLFEASCMMGAITAGADEDAVEKVAGYGRSIGIAFQLVDDLIGVVGDPKVTKKPVGNDIREGKKTLPILLALNKCDEDSRRRILSLLGSKQNIDENELLYAINLMKGMGIDREVREMAGKYADDATARLKGFKESSAKHALEHIARLIVERSA
ncbi:MULTISPECIES: polyprenyl synthetase family protein [Candidatus Nitrosocaldus]|jgi:geranylgeranyl diphosphate synthase type I|uniref:Geranylgeranyl pyrophosphate synthase n=1 Tax=Candidatus Nitrosocaldus cavascurensis TaxID=2058097 RepID=A0A2K5ASR0_9ARCH|nr:MULTISPECIES: polyprenyl synthetase family protein [Candidatus Nitrosocaldus]GBC74589.1 (2E,6E)-farnesyl diphosphate synthase [archaeon HR05]SPC34685.1 geranylgeranyl pyrophosphate synthase [Candidatus Nitrosocaldus cavascurensis]